jgi:phosphatidate cytidylyltransferase
MKVLPEALWLLAGVVALLAVASAIGAALAARASSDKSREVIANLNARTKAWWVMVAVLAAAFACGELGLLILFGLASFFALREFVTLTPASPGDYRPLAVAFYVLIPGQYVLVGTRQEGTLMVMIPVYAFLLLPALAALAGDTREFLTRTGKLQWGLMVCVYCISHASALLVLRVDGFEGRSGLLLLYLLIVVQLSDVLQYVFGKLFGRNKLAPEVSPSKTVEGLLGGGASATAIGGALWWLTPFTWQQSLAMSAAIVLLGFLGGLTLSAVKRSLGAKDWGVMIEGHGGMLDRFDSICFAAPVFFHLTRYFFT